MYFRKFLPTSSFPNRRWIVGRSSTVGGWTAAAHDVMASSFKLQSHGKRPLYHPFQFINYLLMIHTRVNMFPIHEFTCADACMNNACVYKYTYVCIRVHVKCLCTNECPAVTVFWLLYLVVSTLINWAVYGRDKMPRPAHNRRGAHGGD